MKKTVLWSLALIAGLAIITTSSQAGFSIKNLGKKSGGGSAPAAVGGASYSGYDLKKALMDFHNSQIKPGIDAKTITLDKVKSLYKGKFGLTFDVTHDATKQHANWGIVAYASQPGADRGSFDCTEMYYYWMNPGGGGPGPEASRVEGAVQSTGCYNPEDDGKKIQNPPASSVK